MKNNNQIRYKYFEMLKGEYITPILGKTFERRISDNKDFPHFHNFFEIGYCHSGAGKMILGERAHSYTKDSFTLIPPNFPHSTLIETPDIDYWEYLFVDMNVFLLEVYKDNPHLARQMAHSVEEHDYILTMEEYPQLGHLILYVLDNYREKKELYKESVKGLMLALVVEIIRLEKDEFPGASVPNYESETIFATIKYVEKHYTEQIKISEIADYCHLSETHFRRVFRQYMGVAPLAYINIVRIEAACKLLKYSSYTIKEVAFRCGFLSMPAFNKNFGNLVKMAPAEWRKKVREDKQFSEEESIKLFHDLENQEYYGRFS